MTRRKSKAGAAREAAPVKAPARPAPPAAGRVLTDRRSRFLGRPMPDRRRK